jgi:amino acid transporter
VLYFFWKIFKRTHWIHPADADITSGKAALDAEDGQWPEQIPRNIFERIWFWIA